MQRVRLVKSFGFEAAHRLPRLPESHKCFRLHGHSFRADLHVEGPIQPETGWFIDYAEIKEAFDPLHRILDHNYLNEVEGLENPTSENLAVWIWQRLKPALPSLVRVVVHETCTARCEYAGPIPTPPLLEGEG
jgi:6-pyruvoyltetrahydropterin/6-carboxytetrahydropterin synthase